MDAFKAQLDRVREQLAGLTGSQRMLVGTLVAVIALTLGYWARYAGNPELTPVLDQVLTDEQIGQIDHQLDASGVAHSVVAGRVMVSADRKAEALADLMYAQALPADTHSAFEDTTAKSMNWFSSPSQQDAVYNHAKELDLAGVIRRWPGVADAKVEINAKNDRRIGVDVPPSATVDVHTRGGIEKAKLRQLVQAAAAGVAGAVSGLTPDHISVIVDGQFTHAAAADPSGLSAGGDAPSPIELRELNEASLEQKVRAQFSYIPNMTVTVTCDVDTQTRVSDVHKFDKALAFVQPLVEHNQSGQSNTSDASAAREPGVAPNDGTVGGGPGEAASLGGAGAGPVTTSSVSTTDEKTENQSYVPDEVVHITAPAGKAAVVSAAVSVPMSYVTRVFHKDHPSVKDPTDADLQLAAKAEVDKIRGRVADIVGLPSMARVSVDTFADDAVATDLTMAAAAGPAVVGTTSALLTGHAKEIGMAVLAIASLALMAHAARRANAAVLPSPSLAGLNLDLNSTAYDEDDDEAEDRSRAARAAPPQAEVGHAALLIDGMEGMELDAETLRTQQMLDQVSTLVQEDPDAAAALVKRWVSRA